MKVLVVSEDALSHPAKVYVRVFPAKISVCVYGYHTADGICKHQPEKYRYCCTTTVHAHEHGRSVFNVSYAPKN